MQKYALTEKQSAVVPIYHRVTHLPFALFNECTAKVTHAVTLLQSYSRKRFGIFELQRHAGPKGSRMGLMCFLAGRSKHP